MIEIRIHGLGGQGAVTLAEVIAVAAFDNDFFVQAFPSFGPERIGSPVEAYVRIDKKEIRLREHIYHPNFLIFIEEKLLFPKENNKGVNKKTITIVNSQKRSSELEKISSFKNIITSKNNFVIEERFVNMFLAGIFGKKSGLYCFKNLERALYKCFKDKKIALKNIEAAKKGFEIIFE